MNRLGKKCFVGSALAHGLLVLILFVGPAFLTSKETVTPDYIDFVPSIVLEGMVPPGGGSPDAAPAPQPPAPQPAIVQPPVSQPQADPPPPDPEPPKQKTKAPEPEVTKEPPAKEKIDPDALEKNSKPKLTKDALTPKTKSNSAKKQAEAAREAREAEQRAADNARRELSTRLAQAARSIGSGTASATKIGDPGPGGGGPSYASYDSEVQRVYREAWVAPEDVTNERAVTKALVTISRTGHVISAKVIGPSGDAQVDNSVRMTLERVKFVRAFPEGSKYQQRDFIINFDLRVKRGLA